MRISDDMKLLYMANEACERLAMVGFQTNMISYLTQQLHMPMTKAANTFNNFGGTGSLTPLLWAFIAYSFAGRFWTITVAYIIYQIGMISLTLSAILPKLRPPTYQNGQVFQEANTGQLTISYKAYRTSYKKGVAGCFTS
ncbi:hypothetical protein M8C21_012378 [Ambrosia artemisiifolia]|uniref:Uncharacterized protein n=1 Tax=Ambrosia artemisiifolia TaxID=4212 RepID=A0AAD5G5K9_AMBAR|nr:hypothetical protein M8C21_012378 [Ambrosia artemisiifolia]